MAEHVTSIPSPADPTQHIPRISRGGDASNNLRPFRPDDMCRVLDFDDMPQPPDDCTMLHGEGDGDPISDFPERHVCLRGSYLFYFDPADVETDPSTPPDEVYAGPPLGVVPLDRCSVEFPPGGRRVFREHAQTEARNGYEILVKHRGDPAGMGGDDDESDEEDSDDDEDVLSGFNRRKAGAGGGGLQSSSDKVGKNARAPVYLVAESLGQREQWAAAIRIRAEVGTGRPTKLRPGGDMNTPAAAQRKRQHQKQKQQKAAAGGGAAAAGGPAGRMANKMPSANPFGDESSSGSEEEEDEPGRASPRKGGPAGMGGPGARPSPKQQQSKQARGGGGGPRSSPPPSAASGPGSRSSKPSDPKLPGSVDASQLGVTGAERDDVNSALRQFGFPRFDESDWVEDFFRTHNEFDAPGMVRNLERWQSSMKKGLRGAVLEQYEYFVEASKEMTTMGREVTTVRNLVDGQRETVAAMREIDFAAAFADPVDDEYSYYSGDEDDNIDNVLGAPGGGMMMDDDDDDAASDAASSVGTHSTGDWSRRQEGKGGGKRGSAGGTSSGKAEKRASAGADSAGPEGPDDDEGSILIEIPAWLDDVAEEVSAFVKECRYTDATDLIVKARAEVNDITNQSDKLTEKKLSKKQLASMQRILVDLEGQTERMGNRLAEGLRRKNEALKQTSKRERADPLSVLAPLVSPVCLNDDAVALQLLVKLGRPQDAATAYAARRSLLLMESLHERPIASAGSSGTMDVVIYAAQLSQSFFSCLSSSVEGFLDLFLDDNESGGKAGNHDASFDEMSSLNSAAGKNVPAGAIAAVVLWCDSELSKFAAAFGGTRVLGNLALSPPVRETLASPREKRGGAGDRESIAEQRKKLREAEEMGEYAAAAKIRQNLAEREQEEKEEKRRLGRTRAGDDRGAKSAVDNKEREAAIDVASKCVDQAFQFASENLDSIGLPMTPRLAEYIRARLKGCESEIAAQLQGKWEHITFDWNDEGAMDGMEESHMRADD